MNSGARAMYVGLSVTFPAGLRPKARLARSLDWTHLSIVSLVSLPSPTLRSRRKSRRSLSNTARVIPATLRTLWKKTVACSMSVCSSAVELPPLLPVVARIVSCSCRV